MRWPFARRRTEVRNYTSVITDALYQAAAGGAAVSAANTGGAVAAAGLWSRALAVATVTPDALADLLKGSVLANIGLALGLDGEVLYRLDGDRLSRVSDWNVVGTADPASWAYQCSEAGPSSSETRTVPGDRVLHVRINADPRQPWRGRSPLALASETGRLAGGIEGALADEAVNAPRAVVVPAPEGAEGLGGTLTAFRSARGKLEMPETHAGGLSDKGAAPHRDWNPVRMGPTPPAELVTLRGQVEESINACYGIDPVLLASRGDGTLAREALRRFAATVLEPLAVIIADEVEEKLAVRPIFDFEAVAAYDLVGRARALKGLTEAGLSLADARETAGL